MSTEFPPGPEPQPTLPAQQDPTPQPMQPAQQSQQSQPPAQHQPLPAQHEPQQPAQQQSLPPAQHQQPPLGQQEPRQPQQPQSQPPAARQRERRRPLFARPIAVGLIGVLVGAFLVGVPWLVIGLLGGPSPQPLKLPDTLGGFETTQAAVTKIAKGGTTGKSQIERADKAETENASRISAAYGGAAAVFRSYSDPGLSSGFQVAAVRADSPELLAQYEDTAALGQALPSTELKRIGPVQCLIHNEITPAGQTVDPENSFVMSCQRTGGGLTVQLRNTTTEDAHDPARFAAVVEEAWTALGG
ncbi:hypothetical protein VA596_36705 [Amycolatopsis sp., V23-08]|uniref:Serine/threonine protein kinase n=1 Tax=Amycolatopsis heterodermiae TaxID=3110235 RepID=A0ABU5RFT0_9PSEU|nr:hypothetical protein [Amycolatopsis sp., V23-08]MEA5365123.1 hypothetical protein [Amycolatopsis sp., V23-08]